MSAAIDYYLAVFDGDFVNFRRRRIKKKPIQHQQPENEPDPFAALMVSKPKRDVSVKSVKDVATSPNGWNDTTLKSRSIIDKPVEKWNRRELIRHVASIYNLRWGDTLPLNDQHALVNEIIAKIEHGLRTEIQRDGNEILKEYFEFFVETQVPLAALEHGGMSWRKFSYQKFRLAFTRQWKLKQQALSAPQVVIPKPQESSVVELSVDSLTTAYRTSPHVLVREFGVIVTINYLMMVRKQSLEKALLYTKNAIDKVNVADMKEVLAVTEKYSPYPKWLAFTDIKIVEDILAKCQLPKPTVRIEENPVFGFLRDFV